VASAGSSVEALSGALGKQHWKGEFTTEAGATIYAFETDGGAVTCR
jgi:hypothetical protein